MPGSAVSDLAGRVLAGRYLLQGSIGTGASGRVYVADDTRLRRKVAVKVLHAALAEDGAFLRRFRAEAQLAASLHHQHIVTVHDWGEDDVPFMVLELLEGGSLRALLDRGSTLTVPQAARVSRDVASALEYAHARGVLHRDIKPANLLFDEHGIVRVADFGLARALAEASWTEPAGAVFGTARYASPEQAMGAHLDARSDLYSLALVMVESVTGKVPFASDTTLGTLTARTQRSVVAPDALGPLASVVERAGTVEPDDRYPDAATMRQAIADAADLVPPPGPLPLAGMHDGADPHPTRAVPGKTASLLFDQDAVEVLPEPQVQPARERSATPRRLVPFVVAAAIIVVVALVAGAVARVNNDAAAQVPGLVGRTQTDATAMAKRAGFTVRVAEARAAPDPKGTVIDQSPAAGTWSGDTLRIVVSNGPPQVAVPAVVGKAWTDAKKQLDDAGFLYTDPPDQKYDDDVPAGQVTSVSPPVGTKLVPDAPNAKITVVVSKGHAPVEIPDLRGANYDEAKSELESRHFTVPEAVVDFDNEVPKDKVIRTEPAAGTDAPYGSEVVVHVSKGPDLVTVPDLRDMTLEQASDELTRAALQLGDASGWRRGATVKSTSPPRGKKVPRNSTVDLDFRGGLFDSLLG
jgi:serine/threonine-protein kinase